MTHNFDFYDQSTLIARLTRALTKRPQEIVFLVGSPLSAPTPPNRFGVPDVNGVIAMIRDEFEGDLEALRLL